MGLPFQVQAAAVTTELYAKPADALVNLAASHARSEFLLCQKHPEYRPYSALARIERKPLRNRVLRQAAARLPVSPEPLLRVLFQIADRLRSVPGIERLAVRLLGYRISVAFWRSAAQEAGSWQTLREQFGAPTPVPKPADIPSKLV